MIDFKETFLRPEDIILPKDYIPDPERLQEMNASIKEKGRLLHSPCIKSNHEVVTGKLRILASRGVLDIIRCEEVPSDLDEDEYKAISLHENLFRNNLPWNEVVIGEKELHELRMRQAVGDDRGKQGKKAAWGLRETAAELHISLGGLTEDLKMADAILANPSYARIKDKTTAKRVISEEMKRFSQEVSASTPSNIDVDVCHLGYSDAVLGLYPDNSFDVCITDPPWLEFKDDSLTRDEFTLPVFTQVYRVLKNNSFLYAFVGVQDWIFYFDKLKGIGFNVQKYPLIWVKEGVLTYGTRTWEYQRDYELIVLAVKGNPALTSSMRSAVFTHKVVPAASLRHPNEKPVGLLKHILEQCSYEGSTVLDPFAGSGAVGLACKEAGRKYVLVERDQKYFSRIIERLK